MEQRFGFEDAKVMSLLQIRELGLQRINSEIFPPPVDWSISSYYSHTKSQV